MIGEPAVRPDWEIGAPRLLLPELIDLPAGSFRMGASADDKFATETERPAHRVTFSRSFAIGRYPVTVGEYRCYWPGHEPEIPESWPAVGVSWHDATAYCGWLAGVTGRPFRLPTEAEWEYACRAGSVAAFATGSDIGPALANYLYSEAGERIGFGRRTPVGTYPSNSFGLHDLHGNVCEWVADAWHPNHAGASPDGAARLGARSARRVIRGGAWDHLPRLLRSAWRDALPPDARRDNVGFRLAASPEE